MTESPQAARLGSFALVSYIPEPLASFLYQFRNMLPGLENPQPHITILPPRPLTIPVDVASAQCLNVLSRFHEFEVVLGTVRSFPSTNVLYLDVSKGNAQIRHLHDALSTGELDHEEEFDFSPHLTLSGYIASHELMQTQRRAEGVWDTVAVGKTFILREVVGLWLDPTSEDTGWQRMWSQQLRADAKAAWAGMPAPVSSPRHRKY